MELCSHRIDSLSGQLTVPGDKSISHRTAILGGLAQGTSLIDNFLCSEDCLNTLHAMEQLGAQVQWIESEGYSSKRLAITGVAMTPVVPTHAIDCGNSGTGMRLLTGVLAACPFNTELFGDASLSSRPMGRIITPLEQMGARIMACGTKPGCAPLQIQGTQLAPLTYTLPMASAQVKSAILLAGMFTHGTTCVRQPAITRDHTERLFEHFGIPFTQDELSVSITGLVLPKANNLVVPADISSAAFWLVAAATRPGSKLVLKNVGLNPTRAAVIDVLRRMGVKMAVSVTQSCGEPYGDITVYGADALQGTEILPEEIPILIDEIPVLAIAGALCQGDLVIRNARELRVKETDRITTTVTNLRAMGANVSEWDDGMTIHGGTPLHGARMSCYGDHRIAMSFLIAGFSADGTTVLTDTECINTSYPEFSRDLGRFLA